MKIDRMKVILGEYKGHIIEVTGVFWFGKTVTGKLEDGTEIAFSFDEVEQIKQIVEESKPTNDWILCSERMPEECINVLFQIKGIIDPDQFAPRVGHFDMGHWWMYIEPQYSRVRINDEYEVVAWQPLPEKYVEPEPIDIFEAAGFSKEICELANKTCEDIGCKPETIIDLLNFIKERSF